MLDNIIILGYDKATEDILKSYKIDNLILYL